jgi:hypothetical protein
MKALIRIFLSTIILGAVVFGIVIDASADYLPPINISTLPENPKEGESITISIHGDFPNTCYYFEDGDPIQHSLSGNNIDILISYSVITGVMCLQVLVPWDLTEDIGALYAGTYYVRVFMNGVLNNTYSFEVTDMCFNNFDCGMGFYCAKSAGNCYGSGICVPTPTICPTLWDPICGCNGITYPNECVAAIHGASVDYKGECSNLKLGDINRDGSVDISDVILILRIALLIDPQVPCSDINNDGNVDISDVILTLRIALGIDPLKPCTE